MFKSKPSEPVLLVLAFKQFCALKAIAIVALLSLSFVLAYLLTTAPLTVSATTTNNVINFQARLETNTSAIAPDGYYNVTFHLFSASSSTGSTDTGCGTDTSCEWTESYTYNSGNGGTDARIRVVNGYLTANLGSLTTFPSTINWDQQQWLTMDIGGTVGSGTLTWDGQMTPRLLLTATPYALSAQQMSYTNGSGNRVSLQFTSPTVASEAITLPDAPSGAMVCYQNASACGFLTGSGAGVQLQSSIPGTAQTGNFNISGTGIVGMLQATTLDTASATVLNIGPTNATQINLNQNTVVGNNKSFIANGAATFADAMNSTTAFQVQGSSTVLDVDTSNGRIGIGTSSPGYALDISGGTASFNSSEDGSLTAFSTNSIAAPITASAAASVEANGYIYYIGGNTGTVQSSVYYASLSANGSVGAWTTNANALPAARYLAAAVVANGYVYMLGGNNGSSAQSTVYYAKLNADGSTGTWTTNANALPAAKQSGTAVVANGYIYYFGGSSSTTVYYAKLNADGSVAAWTTSATPLPAATQDASAVAANGYIYVVGGTNSAAVYYSSLNVSTGANGIWTTSATPLPAALTAGKALVANGYLYFIGGNNGTNAQSAVYYSQLNNTNGSNAPWTINANSLPNGRAWFGSITANGYMYVLGGDNSSGGHSNTIYYASTARVYIASDLDLLGHTSQLTGFGSANSGGLGSVGGSIYAGNIYSNGTLEVTGNAQLAGGVGVTGPLSIHGNAEIASGSLCVKSTDAACAGSTAGTIYATTTSVSSADLAENYISAQILEPGDVVMPAQDGNNQAVVKTGLAYQPQVIGVISTAPGVTLNSDAVIDSAHPYKYPVALSGRVPVKVSTINGPISVGDELTASSIPGVAMKASSPGPVIGKALESYTASDPNTIATIMVFINLSWIDSNLQPAQGNLTSTITSTILFKNMSDSSSAFTIQNSSGSDLLTADTSNMIITVTSLSVIGTLTVNGHIITGGISPTIAVNSNLCIGSPTTATITGNDESGAITIQAGTGCKRSDAALVTVTFHTPYTAVPRILISPVGKKSTLLDGYVDQSATTFEIYAINGLSDRKTYTWNYGVSQ